MSTTHSDSSRECQESVCQRVFVEEDVVIPPRIETAVPARTTLVTLRTYTETGMVEARTIQSGVYVGRTMLPPWHRGMAVRIANTTDKPVTLTSNTFLGQVIPVEIVSSQEDRSVPMKSSKPHRSYDPNSNEIRIRDAYKIRVVKEDTEVHLPHNQRATATTPAQDDVQAILLQA